MKIVFDFDGTVADSMPELQEIAVRLITKNYEVSDETAFIEYMDTVGLSFREQLDEIFPYDSRNERVAKEYESHQVGIYDTVGIFDDVYEALELAVDGGAVIAICSSSYASFTWPVIKRKLDGYHFLITGREYGPKVSQLKRLTHREYGGAWFIGDGLRDGEIAQEAKVNFVGVTRTFGPHLFEAAGLTWEADLPAAVSRALASTEQRA